MLYSFYTYFRLLLLNFIAFFYFNLHENLYLLFIKYNLFACRYEILYFEKVQALVSICC